MTNNFVTAFITSNHLGLVQDLSELAFSLKVGRYAKIWPMNVDKSIYPYLATEYENRQKNSGFGGLVKPPTLEELLAHRYVCIGNGFKPKAERYFACCSLSHIGIMTSAETAVDAYSVTGCTLFIEEVENIDDTDRVFNDYYIQAIKWKAGYFKAVTFPALPPIFVMNVLYELPYLDFIAKEEGIPGWMNVTNPLIGPGCLSAPLLPGGGDGDGRNG